MKEIDAKKNNILYTTFFGHMMGGGQWSLFYLVKHLNKDRFHPLVLCPEEGELTEKMKAVGADVVCLDMGRMRHINPFVLRRLISIIREREIALIHSDSTTEIFYAGIAAMVLRIPLIWHIRVSDGNWFLDRVLSFLSTRLILVSKALSSRFWWLKNSQKIHVVYNAIDVEEFDNFPASSSIKKEFNIGKDTVLLACVGRIEKRKGQEYLVSAMRHVDNAKLILAGREDEGYLKRIKSLCEELGISDRIIYAGYRKDIPSIMKEIDILVFPSIMGEGFPRAILEAMAAKKPVIATDVKGNTEAIIDGKTGHIVSNKDTVELADKINVLVNNKEKREQMGLAGRKRVEEFFNIQKNVKKTQELYLEILKKRK